MDPDLVYPIILACRRCGTVFRLPHGFQPGSSVTIKNSSATCPRCQSNVAVPNGKYHVPVLQGPIFGPVRATREELGSTRERIQVMLDEGADADEIIEEITRRNSALGHIARTLKPTTSGEHAAWASVLALILLHLLDWSRSHPEAAEIPEPVVIQIVEGACTDPSAPTVPPTPDPET